MAQLQSFLFTSESVNEGAQLPRGCLLSADQGPTLQQMPACIGMIQQSMLCAPLPSQATLTSCVTRCVWAHTGAAGSFRWPWMHLFSAQSQIPLSVVRRCQTLSWMLA